MITEDYCSATLLKLLKDKGFPFEKPKAVHGVYIPAVSLSRAMKWLREEHKISIEIYCIPSYTEGLVVWRYMIRNCETCDEVDYPNGYPAQECITFEEAVEAALKYTLENLI